MGVYIKLLNFLYALKTVGRVITSPPFLEKDNMVRMTQAFFDALTSRKKKKPIKIHPPGYIPQSKQIEQWNELVRKKRMEQANEENPPT